MTDYINNPTVARLAADISAVVRAEHNMSEQIKFVAGSAVAHLVIRLALARLIGLSTELGLPRPPPSARWTGCGDREVEQVSLFGCNVFLMFDQDDNIFAMAVVGDDSIFRFFAESLAKIDFDTLVGSPKAGFELVNALAEALGIHMPAGGVH